jgi:hypothetical protein
VPVSPLAILALDRVSVLTALVAVETVVLALLALVTVGLLRSHAEILRRLPDTHDDHDHAHEGDEHGFEPSFAEGATIPAHLPGPRGAATPVVDISGPTLDGAQVAISPAKTDTLVAFLSSGCLTCKTFWDGLQPARREPLPGGARLVVVVKDRDKESPSRLRDLAPTDLPVVMSSQAWEDYGVTMSPYFLFVGASSGTVRSEGAASSWEQVRSLLTDAIDDERIAIEAAARER